MIRIQQVTGCTIEARESISECFLFNRGVNYSKTSARRPAKTILGTKCTFGSDNNLFENSERYGT